MKKIILIIISLFLIITLGNLVSACFSTDYEFTSTIMGLKPAQNITMEKIMQMCTKETCIINESTKTITIQSYYDNRVALIFSQGNYPPDNSTRVNLMIKLPYKSNQSCHEPSICYPIPDTINPESYNWKKSTETDLNYLKNLSIIDISDSDIENISNQKGNIVYCEGGWSNADGCAYYLNDVNESSPTYQQRIFIPQGQKIYNNCMGSVPGFISILPIKEFILNQKSPMNFPNLIYWVIGIIILVIVIVILILLLRNKKR